MRFFSQRLGTGLAALCLLFAGMFPTYADDFRKFDEWGDLPFSNEKARLDNIAIQWHNEPSTIVYLIIFAGRTACVGEAKARGARAKNYLVGKRRVQARHVVVIDGGYKESVLTEVWFLPPNVSAPTVFPEFNLKPSEVTFEKNCRIKCRACR